MFVARFRALSPRLSQTFASHPHVLGHIFAPLALQKLRLGHLGTKAVLSQRLTCVCTFLPLSKRYVLTVMSYGDTRHCTHDDDSADIENLTFKSAHETLSM